MRASLTLVVIPIAVLYSFLEPQSNSTLSQSNHFTNQISLTGISSNTTTPILGWKDFRFGLAYDEVKNRTVKKHPSLIWKKNPPSLSTRTIKNYLKTYETPYYKRVEFQFSEERLYLIRLTLNQRYFSFLRLYEGLYQKYGPPQENNSKEVIWKNEERQVSLTRLSVVTYQDSSVGITESQGSLPQNRKDSSFLNQHEFIEQIIKDL